MSSKTFNRNVPGVTIAIPFYNARATLTDAIRSVFCQTYTNWELLLLDDGSTDGSLELAQAIDDERVNVVSDGTNRGLIYRLNQIPSLASADLLARMDADDMMHPQRIAEQVNYLERNTEIDLVDSATYSIDQQGRPKGIRGLTDINLHPDKLLRQTILLHASVVGRKEWFVKHLYDNDYPRAEDYELWYRTHRESKFGRIKKPLYIVREGNVNVDNYASSMKTIRKIVHRYGHEVMSDGEITRFIFQSHVKVLLYRVLSVFGAHHILAQKRNSSLSMSEQKELKILLKKIYATPVPMFR